MAPMTPRGIPDGTDVPKDLAGILSLKNDSLAPVQRSYLMTDFAGRGLLIQSFPNELPCRRDLDNPILIQDLDSLHPFLRRKLFYKPLKAMGFSPQHTLFQADSHQFADPAVVGLQLLYQLSSVEVVEQVKENPRDQQEGGQGRENHLETEPMKGILKREMVHLDTFPKIGLKV